MGEGGHGSRAWAPRCLVLQHEADTPPGLIADWLAEQSASVEILRVDQAELRADPREYELIVVLGSEHAAYDDSLPFLAPEIRILTAAQRSGVPILGVCFGGQLLARALGARVFRLGRPEIGWARVRTHDPDLIGEGPWFQWHFDAFDLPVGATLVAENEVGVQAFVAGRSLGLQCHPEVTLDIVAGWARGSADAGVDPNAVIEETSRRAAASHEATWRLLDGFRDKVVRAHRAAPRPGTH